MSSFFAIQVLGLIDFFNNAVQELTNLHRQLGRNRTTPPGGASTTFHQERPGVPTLRLFRPGDANAVPQTWSPTPQPPALGRWHGIGTLRLMSSGPFSREIRLRLSWIQIGALLWNRCRRPFRTIFCEIRPFLIDHGERLLLELLESSCERMANDLIAHVTGACKASLKGVTNRLLLIFFRSAAFSCVTLSRLPLYAVEASKLSRGPVGLGLPESYWLLGTSYGSLD